MPIQHSTAFGGGQAVSSTGLDPNGVLTLDSTGEGSFTLTPVVGLDTTRPVRLSLDLSLLPPAGALARMLADSPGSDRVVLSGTVGHGAFGEAVRHCWRVMFGVEEPTGSVDRLFGNLGHYLGTDDYGRIVYNLWRLAGFSEERVNWRELLLGLIGVATTGQPWGDLVVNTVDQCWRAVERILEDDPSGYVELARVLFDRTRDRLLAGESPHDEERSLLEFLADYLDSPERFAGLGDDPEPVDPVVWLLDRVLTSTAATEESALALNYFTSLRDGSLTPEEFVRGLTGTEPGADDVPAVRAALELLADTAGRAVLGSLTSYGAEEQQDMTRCLGGLLRTSSDGCGVLQVLRNSLGDNGQTPLLAGDSLFIYLRELDRVRELPGFKGTLGHLSAKVAAQFVRGRRYEVARASTLEPEFVNKWIPFRVEADGRRKARHATEIDARVGDTAYQFKCNMFGVLDDVAKMRYYINACLNNRLAPAAKVVIELWRGPDEGGVSKSVRDLEQEFEGKLTFRPWRPEWNADLATRP